MKTNTAQLALTLVRNYQTPPYRCTGRPGLHHGADENCPLCRSAVTPEPFTSTRDNVGGGWFCGYALDGVTTKALRAAFGAPVDTGCDDEEKGYDGLEYRFLALGGAGLTLYTRYGVWRVRGTDEGLADRFLAWLQGKLSH